MDWTQIIIAFIAAGGITAVFTIGERKRGMFMENVSRVSEEWQKIAESRKAMYDDLKSDYDKLGTKYDEQLRVNASLRHKLDDANTEKAVARLLKCTLTGCPNRKPPLGAGMEKEQNSAE